MQSPNQADGTIQNPSQMLVGVSLLVNGRRAKRFSMPRCMSMEMFEPLSFHRSLILELGSTL